ncbi:MAG: AAA family ATPase [Saprospiraceae bacterium]|nr:AAA family ATPase [Saprospiraceae bacterium]
MFLSKLIIRNFRSIKNLELDFEPGKNIIVGKNNAGKSNIIKAIDLVLGENSPAYYKYENVSENDFYSEKRVESDNTIISTANEITIVCILKKDEAEQLNYDLINSCFGFYKLAFKPSYNTIHERRILFKDFSQEEINEIYHFDLDDTAAPGYLEKSKNAVWVDGKLKSQRKFEEEFEAQNQFAFIFKASKTDNGRITKEIRFLYREQEHCDWHMGFSAPVRNELLQSAIINSFRDPQNTLRINQWSWFGKLLRQSINNEDEDLKNAFAQLKTASDKVFTGLHKDMNDSRIHIAFPDTEISIQFNPDTKMDIYKSALIYVDDGFNSQLQDKGSGIQSAVIIGLFNYYIRSYAHHSSSLLIVEEPEIYLHPQGRRVISNRIDDFLENNRSQAIITTHSTEFITSAHDNLNIILARKVKEQGTVASNAHFSTSKERQILVQRQNAEMFFSDKVLLVEGGDKYVLEAVAQFYGIIQKPNLGKNWLDEKNCSVIATGSKNEFFKYYNKLKELGIEVYILADFDFLLRGLADFFTATQKYWRSGVIDAFNALNGQINQDLPRELPQEVNDEITKFSQLLKEKGLNVSERIIRKEIRNETRLKHFDQIADDKKERVSKCLEFLKAQKIMFLKGELENQYTDKLREAFEGKNMGKEEKPIYLVSELLGNPEDISHYINVNSYFEFLDVVTGEWT